MSPFVIESFYLIKGHLPDILYMEAGNLSHIYLYCADDYRVEFERSAFDLCRAYTDDSIISSMKVANAPVPIVMANVKSKDVLEVAHNLYCLRHTEKIVGL